MLLSLLKLRAGGNWDLEDKLALYAARETTTEIACPGSVSTV